MGKEYNDDELIFEGLFKNGKRLRGKEYENDKVVFEGEYFEGKRWKEKNIKMEN